MKQALIIIDIQNDYFPGGTNELFGATDAANNAKVVLEQFRKQDAPIFFIQHFNSESSSFFRPNTSGAEIHTSIKPFESETIIQKNYPNSFKNTDLLDRLKTENIEQLVVVGMMSHMCIDATVRAAKDLDFDCILLNDCCATKDLVLNDITIPAIHVHTSFMGALNGYYATIQSSSDFLSTL